MPTRGMSEPEIHNPRTKKKTQKYAKVLEFHKAGPLLDASRVRLHAPEHCTQSFLLVPTGFELSAFVFCGAFGVLVSGVRYALVASDECSPELATTRPRAQNSEDENLKPKP